ncbi:MAG: DNA replication/repair protein RecF [Spirochaetales bacterium]|nr:DNA replication/repair protein RecF [Spirochaetales bacterium]
MRFCTITTNQFRNLKEEPLEVDASKVLLIGPNGQGKTNLLEALYTLCYGSSFRTAQIKELATYGFKDFRIEGTYRDERNLLHTLILTFKDNKRVITLDGTVIRDRKELIYNIPTIVFSHDDIFFVKGEPEYRRKFFDQTMSMYNPLFFDDHRRYRQVLRQRNQAIKDEQYSLLPIYDQQLARHGIAIQRERIRSVYEFLQIFPEIYQEVSRSDTLLDIEYQPSWEECATEEEVVHCLESHRRRDIKLQTTTSGIHRDQFMITEDGYPFANKGSTGQLRLASLALRVAQMAYFTKKTDKEAVILVDDVLLELDIPKRERFLTILTGYSQAFFTFLPEERYIHSFETSDRKVYHVSEGAFTLGQ